MKTITKAELDKMETMTFRSNDEAICYLAHKNKEGWHIEGALSDDSIITEGMNITYVPYMNLHEHLFTVREIVYRDHKTVPNMRHFTAECDFIQVVYPQKK